MSRRALDYIALTAAVVLGAGVLAALVAAFAVGVRCIKNGPW